jgi:hypothetical protein
MTRSAPGNRFRTRKLSTKQSLAVLRENQIDSVEDEGQRNIPQIETGVEHQEEIVRCLLSPSLSIFGTRRDDDKPNLFAAYQP